MKQTLKIVGLVCALAILFTACGAKKEIDGKQFTETMQAADYVITDLTAEYSDMMQECYLASDYVGNAIQLNVYTDKNEALEMFASAQAAFGAGNLSGVTEKSQSSGSFQKYSIESKETYQVICQVGKTILIASSDVANKGSLDKMIASLGY